MASSSPNLMGSKPQENLDISDYLECENIDYSHVINLVSQSIESEKQEEAELAAAIEMNYTPIVHRAFLEENETVLSEFQKIATKHHFYTLKELAPITDYHTAVHIVKQVSKTNQRYAFINLIKSVLEVSYYTKVHRMTPTREAFLELAQYAGQRLTKQELDTIILNVSKKYKRSKRVNIEKIINNYFYHEKTRSNKERFVTLHVLKPEHLMQTYGINEIPLKKAMAKVAEGLNNIQKIVLETVLKIEA